MKERDWGEQQEEEGAEALGESGTHLLGVARELWWP